MVVREKQRQALHAINGVLIVARTLAHENKNEDLAIVLDIAEYLPALMLETADRTTDFRDQLVGLAARFPVFTIALQRFDADGA